jgi:hypothetical protein
MYNLTEKMLKEKSKMYSGFPFWYTEFSLQQVNYKITSGYV